MCECISILLMYKYDIYFIWYVLHVFPIVLTCITYCISHIIHYRSYRIHKNHISYATYHISCYYSISYTKQKTTWKQQTWMHFPVWQSALTSSRMGPNDVIFKDPLKLVLCKWNFVGCGFKYFLFLPLPGEMIQFDEHIFPIGWRNQLVLNNQFSLCKWSKLLLILQFSHVGLHLGSMYGIPIHLAHKSQRKSMLENIPLIH